MEKFFPQGILPESQWRYEKLGVEVSNTFHFHNFSEVNGGKKKVVFSPRYHFHLGCIRVVQVTEVRSKPTYPNIKTDKKAGKNKFIGCQLRLFKYLWVEVVGLGVQTITYR